MAASIPVQPPPDPVPGPPERGPVGLGPDEPGPDEPGSTETPPPPRDRYLLALALIVATIIAIAVAADSAVGRLVAVTIEGLALVVILRNSHVQGRWVRLTAIALAAVIGTGLVAAQAAERSTAIAAVVFGALLALVAPVAIVRNVLRHPRIDLTTIAGALCVYLLAGIFFAYVYGLVGTAMDDPFFAQATDPSDADFVYFSFVTLATLGYGDLTARTDLGRILSASEALLGQLYLVSVVALLVGNLGRERGIARGADQPTAGGQGT